MSRYPAVLAFFLTAAISLPAQVADIPQQGAAPAQQLLTPDQLDDLVAPIALYPDPLISQVLVASTYPLELVAAQQWVQRSNGMNGQALVDAARQQPWDPSVQALVAFPDVLNRLNSDIQWTTDLGNAFLAQQQDVMSAIQRMRASAEARGRLRTTSQVVVQGSAPDIEIIPANPEYIYVPEYDPEWVWGPPAWGYYPYLYYPTFGFGWYPGIDIGFCFGGWGGWGFGGWGWGWGPNWHNRSIFVNNNFFNHYGYRGGFAGGFGGGFRGGFGGRSAWTHDPGHRLGVPYPNGRLAGRFQGASMAGRANFAARGGFSGMNGAGVRGGSFGGGRGAFGGTAAGGGRNSFGASRNGFGQAAGAGRGGFSGAAAGGGARGSFGASRNGFGQAAGAGRGGFGNAAAGGGARGSFGASRNAFGQPGGAAAAGGRQSFQGGFRSTVPQSGGGSWQHFQGRQSAPPLSRSSAPAFNGGARSFSGGGMRSYSAPSYGGGRSYSAPARNFGGGARSYSAPSFNHSFGGGARSYSAPSRSFGGGGAAPSFNHSFGGGGGARSFGGGGGARSFGGGGGGGARSFGGGGGGARSFGGGGGGGGHVGGGGGHGGGGRR